MICVLIDSAPEDTYYEIILKVYCSTLFVGYYTELYSDGTRDTYNTRLLLLKGSSGSFLQDYNDFIVIGSILDIIRYLQPISLNHITYYLLINEIEQKNLLAQYKDAQINETLEP